MSDHMLSVTRHDRDESGMLYVYPVVSRRAGGVSVGINLNPNHACNWRCLYCQVPDLQRGSAPELDLQQLTDELDRMLAQILFGDFMQQRVPENCRVLRDIALSGNGEPTSSRQFAEVIDVIAAVRAKFGLGEDVKTVLITNGSYVHRPHVQAGLRQMADMAGEVWIKVDRATASGIAATNDVQASPALLRKQVEVAAALCPTWVQSCWFALDDQQPDESEVEAYIDFLAALQRDRVPVQGVLLYGVARQSMQPEAGRLSSLGEAWMQALAQRIEAVGLRVKWSL